MNYWLKSFGIDGEYVRQPVEPGKAEAFLKSLADHGFVGCNVTIPHKERVVPLVERRTEEAVATGAVNTITKEGRRLVGHNTDGDGFADALGRAGWSFQQILARYYPGTRLLNLQRLTPDQPGNDP